MRACLSEKCVSLSLLLTFFSGDVNVREASKRMQMSATTISFLAVQDLPWRQRKVCCRREHVVEIYSRVDCPHEQRAVGAKISLHHRSLRCQTECLN